MEEWKYHSIFFLKSSRSIKILLSLLNSITWQNERWYFDWVDIISPLHDQYNEKVLTKEDINTFIDQIDTITEVIISVILSDNTTKVKLHCFDSNWVHVYTNNNTIMTLFTKYLCENDLGTVDLEESFESDCQN